MGALQILHHLGEGTHQTPDLAPRRGAGIEGEIAVRHPLGGLG